MEAAFCPRSGHRSHVDARDGHGGAVGHRRTAYVLDSVVAGERGPRPQQRQSRSTCNFFSPCRFPRRSRRWDVGRRAALEGRFRGGYFWVTERSVFTFPGCHPTLIAVIQHFFLHPSSPLHNPPITSIPMVSLLHLAGKGVVPQLGEGEGDAFLSFFWQFHSGMVRLTKNSSKTIAAKARPIDQSIAFLDASLLSLLLPSSPLPLPMGVV